MGVYSVTSSQDRIKAQKAETAAAKKNLAGAPENDPGHWNLVGAALAGSLKVLALISFPTLLSIIPVVYVALHVDREYGTQPAGPGEITIGYKPASARIRVEPTGSGEAARGSGRLNISADGSVRLVQGERLLAEISPGFQQARLRREPSWLDRLAGTAALPADGDVEELRFELARKELVALGPDWIRGWEFFFIFPLVVLALSLRWLLGLQ